MKSANTFRNNGRRHASVVNFSREHHFGLVFCRHMRQLIRNEHSPSFVRLLFAEFWKHELKEHMEKEEIWMASQTDSEILQKAYNDHNELRNGFEQLGRLSLPELDALAVKLEEHIRFEERILFPQVAV